MGKPLIIVESPAKAKVLSKYLGGRFTALASYGHVRDLLSKSGAVDTDNNFSMNYELVQRNEKHLKAIIKAMKSSEALYLATDPDREGEAISWHIYEILKKKKLLENKEVYRVEFHEITKNAIIKAVESPRKISYHLVNAQQARRALDYLVGFNLSPLLWRKVRKGLSAGRVQSPALRMICEREQEIDDFIKREYWSITAQLSHDQQSFLARLSYFNNEKIEQFTITETEHAHEIVKELEQSESNHLKVKTIELKQRKRNPAPPFVTSTLQQEASRKLKFSAKQTMQLAQQLYEGIELDGELSGLITYMRTDSYTLSQSAVQEIRALIEEKYGSDLCPKSPRVFKNKSKNSQEAHEAIRPTSVYRLPSQLSSKLTDQQYKLYDLIWKRTVSSQMKHALIDTVSVDLMAGGAGVFRATGSTIAYQGFLQVYQESLDDQKKTDDESLLPKMKVGDLVLVESIKSQQHFTEPPPRYNEATLVKSLEHHGIGRPSTYVSIISTLQKREYVVLNQRRFYPTDTGKVVNRFLTEHFFKYVDYLFTANLENDLDAISRGEKQWVPLLADFWKDFSKQVEDKKTSVSRADIQQSRVLGIDPKTKKEVSVKFGPYGPYAQIGVKDDDEKPKFASLRDGQKIDDITLSQALALFLMPRYLGQSDDGVSVQVAIGRFGPYIKYGAKNISLDKHYDPYSVDLETVTELIQQFRDKEASKVIADFKQEGIRVLNGRYGPYVTDGAKNARVPKNTDPQSLTVTNCLEILKAYVPGKKRVPGKFKK